MVITITTFNMIIHKISKSYSFQHSPLMSTCLNLCQVGSSSSSSPLQQMFHHESNNLLINKVYIWSNSTLTSHTSFMQTSPNYQSPYKVTTIHRNTWVSNHCNRRSNRIVFRYMVHSTS
jgi:hypothetical protein